MPLFPTTNPTTLSTPESISPTISGLGDSFSNNLLLPNIVLNQPNLTVPSPAPSAPGKPGRKPKRPLSDIAAPEDEEVALKRQRNNVAAKKYRQKKVDRIDELEAELEETKRERDELRIKLARQEAETAALREMLKMNVSGYGSAPSSADSASAEESVGES